MQAPEKKIVTALDEAIGIVDQYIPYGRPEHAWAVIKNYLDEAIDEIAYLRNKLEEGR